MSLVKSLPVVLILLAIASMVVAAEDFNPEPEMDREAQMAAATPEAVEAAAAALETGDETVLAPRQDCEAGLDLLATNGGLQTKGGLQATPAVTLFCGSCSTPNCIGAARGNRCWLPRGGWGTCNIFSGGPICSDARLNCQCADGDLP